jgi:uncharacterized protein DUF4058
MRCPFPGMDPYIERPAIWADFHDSLITYAKSALQPQLRPRYLAVSADRLYVVESERSIRPDVSIVSTGRPFSSAAPTALLEPDAPTVFELGTEEIREPVIHIIEPTAGNRIVTAIEIISPSNKEPGPGRDSYLAKREEYWHSGTNVVEVDLLRKGDLTVRVSSKKLKSLQLWHYLAVVTRRVPARQEVYPIILQGRLPRIAIPLAPEDRDVTLDLQAVFARCWEEGPYPELLHYDEPPPSTMSSSEVGWCAEQLRAAGMR